MTFPAALPFRAALVGLALIPVTASFAQQGDKAGHVMKPPPAHWKIPPAPVVSAGDAAATMALEDGFELQLVASEPMIHDPVALAFDGMGRMWVAEMRGYMPDIDGKLEESTYGRISVLEDSDGDGAMDRSTVFLEDYLLPRALALVDADRGLLFADNEKLYEAEILIDESGKIRPGKVVVVDEKYAEGGNPEHKPNGLLRALDNWTYNAKCDLRYRKVGGEWIKEKTEERGQWGIAQDDHGRLLTNTNSNLVSVEGLAPGLRVRNPHYTFRTSTTATIKDQRLWPSRMNPGVNRGYMEGVLDGEGHLVKPTAASGMVVYRGDQFPERYYGNIFITEPAGNLIKRAVSEIGEKGLPVVRSATEGKEFLTSTDERSRMVNAYTAPDGTLYLIDFYRGILQHAAYMTSFLRAQVVERKLDTPVGMGRIWRVSHREGKKERRSPRLAGQSSADLVASLSDANAWWRETAQRLIVERGGGDAVPGLRKMIADGGEPAAIHAIWTMEGLGKLDATVLETALARSPVIAAQAIRAAESLAGTDQAGEILTMLKTLGQPADPALQRQLAASLGLFGDDGIAPLAAIVAASKDPLVADLAASGISGHELALFQALPVGNPLRIGLIEAIVARNVKAEWTELLAGIASADGFRTVARSATTQRRGEIVHQLLAKTADGSVSADFRKAIVSGMLAGGKDKKFKPIPVKELDALEQAKKEKLLSDKDARQVAALFKIGTGEEEVFLLTDAHRAQFKMGEAQYQRICLGCHQIHGNGQQFLAPPLVGSEWVLGSEKRLIALVMDGVMGPIEVLGKTYTVPEIQPLMPGLRLNPEVNDEQLAAILTYVRNAWGNGAPPVSKEALSSYRESVEARAPWSPEELKALK